MTKKVTIPDINTTSLDTLPVAVILFDNSQIHYINPAGLEILEVKDYKKFFSKKRSIFDFLLKDYHEKIRKNNLKILSGKSYERHEFSIKTPSGIICDLESRSNLVMFNGKKVIQTIIIEITKRKKYERELLETGELFSLLNKHANDIFFKFDFFPKPHYAFISDSVYDVLGYHKKDFINNPSFYLQIIHPEDRTKFIYTQKDYKRFLTTKQHTNTARFYNKKKEIVWLETVYTPIKDTKENIISFIGISRNVTDAVQIENKLIETQEKFNLISTKANEMIYFFTYVPKPKYLFVSPSVKNILGYDEECFYKDPFFINKKTIGADNDLKRHEIVAAKEQKQNKLKPRSVTYQASNKNGETVWLEDSIVPVKNKDGKIKFIFGLVRNITELKQKEIELNQKWSNYRELLDTSPIAYFIHNNGVCLMCNKEAVKILKVKSSDAIIGKYIVNYIIPEQRELALKRLKHVLSGKELDFVPYKITNSKGQLVSVELKSVPVKYNGINAVLTIIQDVSQKEIYAREKLRAEVAEEHNKSLLKEIDLRKKAENKLLQNEKLLIDQAAKLAAIFESSSHLVWTVNKKLELTYFNNNYRTIFKNKYGIEPVLNKTVTDLTDKKTGKEINSLWNPYYERVLKGEHVEFERKDSDKNGREIYREVFLSPIKNNKGEIFEIACLAHDITEGKKFEKENIEQAAKIKAIFESGTSLIWTVNKEGIYTSFNRNFAEAIFKVYGRYPEEGKKMVGPINSGRLYAYRQFWAQKQNEAFGGKTVEFMVQFPFESNRKQYYQQVYLRPIYGKNDEVIEVSGIGFDVTDKVINEQKLSNQASKLNAIFEGGTHFIWTINRRNELTAFNQNYAAFIKRVYNIESKIGTVINKGKMVSKRSYNEWWNNQYEKAFKGEPINFETTFTDKKNNRVYLDVFLNPVYEGNTIVEVSGIAHDITERINNEEQIKEQTAKLKAIFESGSQLIWTANHKKELTSFNQNYSNAIYRLYGFYPELNKSIRELSKGAAQAYQDFWDEKYDLAFSGTPAEFTTERYNLDGTKVYRQYVLYPIKDHVNQVIEVSGLGIDITENKLYEERITQSLKEKEVLLKEVHHRVKNNMQVISSILNLQSSYVTDDYALNLLKESQNRIKTMAYIHESLYQNKTFSSINFSEYITTLANNILHSYTASIQKVKLVMDLQKVILNLDTSIPAGLIINELVTNSIKHAFNEENEGIILINLFTKDNILFLEVSDNGKGFPKEIDFKNTNSLGLQLVNTLVEQLNGTIELKEYKKKGTCFKINFPM